MQMTGAQVLIQALLDQGVDMIFGYPGGAVLNIYDALYERRAEMRHIVTSHEQGAAHAADGYARSTGKTGVVLATSGPGATNLVTGIATAYHDSVPLIAITGNVPTDLIGRDSFQEVDIAGITNPITKHNYIVKDVNELADIVREAFVIANSGRKGPVLIDIPKDVTAAKTEYSKQPLYVPRKNPVPSEDDFSLALQAIARSQRPLIYAGGGVVFSDASKLLAAFSKKISAPVCVSMMGISSVPYNDMLYLGMIGMHGTSTANIAARDCDLLIAIGSRFSDRVAGNRSKFAANAEILHIDIDPSEISKNVNACLSLIGDAQNILKVLTEQCEQKTNSDWVHKLLYHKAHNTLPNACDEHDLSPREIITKLQTVAGEDALIVTDVGQHQMLTAQYYPFTSPRSFISSCGLGTMGYGMGAAIGTKVGNPHRPVALITGDGSFHMNLNELAVAVSNDIPIVILIMNNGVLGMVHQWQRLFYKERYAYTEINRATDFVKLAEAFGAVGMRLDKRSEIESTLTTAFQCGKPCVIDCSIAVKERVYPIIPPGGTEQDMIFSD
ncbi:biosynthetic-type acetolactate synthase large subunit [Hydrogenoanaerobacterium sp.]|uniref:biosynthetic-type acetolactate synthase large subunit n=1 Tax=Hydrogenoanaerobacterium sp. TaxID=2953763 RepID=UPI00289975D3|nr:biosynthetic-type acetolactate synthase large subunit [Hydrogenoanaerobacterium sp.]